MRSDLFLDNKKVTTLGYDFGMNVLAAWLCGVCFSDSFLSGVWVGVSPIALGQLRI